MLAMIDDQRLELSEISRRRIAVGRAKHEMQLAEDRWASGGAKCAVCGQTVPHGERITYFEKGICDYCRHQAEKDD